jgi:hypothetical protein
MASPLRFLYKAAVAGCEYHRAELVNHCRPKRKDKISDLQPNNGEISGDECRYNQG